MSVTGEKQIFNPYVGPRPFDPEEKHLFFGRDSEMAEVASLIIANPAFLLYAQSGAGKTSLFNAGVIPLLEQKGMEVWPVARVSGVIPTGIEPQSISNLFMFNTLSHWVKPAAGFHHLVSRSLEEFLQQRPLRFDRLGEATPRILIFDQFEELFSTHQEHWQKREDFFHQIARALEQKFLRIVFILREDYLAQMDPYRHLLPNELRARYRLERLREEEALEAVIDPTQNTPRSFAPGVAEALVEKLLEIRIENLQGETIEAQGEYVEPVQLQVVCSTFWQNLPQEVAQITYEHLREFGDVRTALSDFYKRVITTAAQQTGLHQNTLRDFCGYYLITASGTRNLVHREKDKTGNIPNNVLDILIREHLITCNPRAGANFCELTHDGFIKAIIDSNDQWAKHCQEKSQEAIKQLFSAENAVKKATEKSAKAKYPLAEKNWEVQALEYYRNAKSIFEEIGDWVAWGSTLISMGDFLLGLADYESAEDAYNEAITIFAKANDSQSCLQILLKICYLYYLWKKDDKFFYTLDKSLKFAEETKEEQLIEGFLSDAGNYLHRLEYFDKAIDYFTKLITFDETTGYSGRAGAYWYSGRYMEAWQDYTHLLETDPHYLNVLPCRGQVLAEWGKYEEAKVDLEKYLTCEQENPATRAYALSGLGLALGGLKKYAAALKRFDRSMVICPDNGWVYYNRAQVYEWMGKFEEARTDLGTALKKKDPPLTPLKRQQAKARLKKSQPAPA